MKLALALLIAGTVLCGVTSAQAVAPYLEDFETSVTGSTSACSNTAALGAWTLPANWAEDPSGSPSFRPDTGGTPSGGTGPSAPFSGSIFLYCEASTSGCGFPSILFQTLSPTVDVSALTAPTLEFYYSANGSGMGTLVVEETDGAGGWTPIYSTPGVDEGDVWRQVVVALNMTGTTQVRFSYTSGATFRGDFAIDDVSFNEPVALTWQQNSAASSLTIDGGQYAVRCPFSQFQVNSTTNLGPTFWDVGLTTTAIVPLGGGGVPTGGLQTINIDVADPSFTLLFLDTTGSLAPHSGVFTSGFGLPAGVTIGGQQAIIDAGSADGMTLSQAVEAFGDSTPTGPLTTALGDDATVNVILGAPPLCFNGMINFYGTGYDNLWVNSNGDVSFTAGHLDFSATVLEWETLMPRIGAQSDLSPQVAGTIIVSETAGLVTVDFQGVVEFGGNGGTQTSTINFDTIGGGCDFSLFQDPTFIHDTVAGISNGAGGTHPGAGAASVSFDAARGTGLLVGLPSDSWIDQATAAGIPNTAGTPYLFISPSADGSTIEIQ